MSKKSGLLKRISESSRQFDSWSPDRKEAALKDARTSSNYGIRAASISSSAHQSLKPKAIKG